MGLNSANWQLALLQQLQQLPLGQLDLQQLPPQQRQLATGSSTATSAASSRATGSSAAASSTAPTGNWLFYSNFSSFLQGNWLFSSCLLNSANWQLALLQQPQQPPLGQLALQQRPPQQRQLATGPSTATSAASSRAPM